MARQQQLTIADQLAAGFLQRCKSVDQMPCRDQNRLLIEQIFNLWPVNQQPLVRGYYDILLQAKIGRA